MTRALPSPRHKIVNEDGEPTVPFYQYLKDADATWRPKVANVATTANSIIPNDGVTLIETVPASTHTLANPSPGVRKIIAVVSTSTTGRVVAASTDTSFFPSAGWRLVFGSSSGIKAIEVVGISTVDWLIVSNPGAITVTT